ncbi:MAG: 2-oxo acid dehydrogenase subunit E2 [Planctomycetes bacterium]|nr:2-oxo acid dehydrogenase subunit E2 [Planctomycetota bacterium]
MTIKQPIDKSQFILPDLGEGVHEAEIISWKVKPGDHVDEHQTLAEMETDKALVEVPSPWSGVIQQLHGKEGDIIMVGSALVSYESSSNSKAISAPSSATKVAQPVEAATDDDNEDAGTVVGTVGASVSISDRFARKPDGEHQTTSNKALATPAVRRVARELGVDINNVPGSGRGGRVTASDIHSLTSGVAPAAPTQASPSTPMPAPTISGDGIAQRIPMRGVRRKIAQALERSVRTAVHYTVVDEADVSLLAAKRKEYAAVTGNKLSFLPFVINAVCRALKQHPSVNANVDDQKEEILIKSVINLGIAVDTDHGLMVPVISNADSLTLAQLDGYVADVASRCRDRSISREELIGGTFSISNVGSYGGIFSTPIINYPEVAILGVGRVREQVLTKDGKFYAGRVMPLSLSCDHRVVDGAEGARFLNTLIELLQDPSKLVS